jgi:ABC-type transporter MlaC component
MRRLFGALFFFLVLGGQPTFAAACPAEGLIQSAGSAFSAAARSGSASAFTSAASRFADLRGLALFALGSYRSDLSAGQEGRYVSLARGFIGRFMADNASSLAGSDGLTITSCSGNTVSAKTAGGSTVIFRLSGGGRIQDVNVAGIWVGIALRDKFTGVIRSHGGDVNALMAYLQQ